MPAEVEKRIGEPQVSTRSGGSGLGLAVAAGVASAHGGHLEVERPETGGSVLRIVLARRHVRQSRPEVEGGTS
jgi:two-component system sensor histidine kinase FlrB